MLDSNLRHFANCVAKRGYDISSFAGSGAAGGIGGAIAGILGGTLKPGIELVMSALKLETQMQNTDLVITAEGSLDGQSASGKTPIGVAKLAQRYQVPVVGLAGQLASDDMAAIHQAGISAVFSIAPGPISKDDAIANAAQYLENTAEQLARLLASMDKRDC